MINKEKILERIRVLLMRTTKNGCTEAEAMEAAEKVNKLLSEYSISMTDVEIGQSGCITNFVMGRHPVFKLCGVPIARFFDCKCWLDSRYEQEMIYFFGLTQDVNSAIWLTEVIRDAMNSEKNMFLVTQRKAGKPVGRTGGSSFLIGMSSRINERLREIKAATSGEEIASTGRNLIVVKNAVVTEQFAKLNLNLRSNQTNRDVKNSSAFFAGREAGNKVGLHRPVGKSEQLKLK